MRLFVAVTDYDWFQVHASKLTVDEVNFWQPSPDSSFKALSPGEPLLFKLHSPRNFIAGGGFFAKFLRLPLSLAWDAFGEGNGVYTPEEGRIRISKYRRVPIAPNEDPNIGCIILAEPFFFPEDLWIPIPSDFSLNVVRGKGYNTLIAKTTPQKQMRSFRAPDSANPSWSFRAWAKELFAYWSRMPMTGDVLLRKSEPSRFLKRLTSSLIRRVGNTNSPTGCFYEVTFINYLTWATSRSIQMHSRS